MKKAFVTILGLAACLVACNKAEKVAPAALDPNRPVQFTVSNIYTLDTKADAIANGKAVAIYAGSPINADNVSATVTMEAGATSGTLAPTVTNSLLWGVGQTTQATKFLAVYPYETTRPLVGETEETKYIEYSITDAESVEYADKFLAAAASQAPGTGETPAKVALAFKHPFAKLVYNISNTSDDFVASAAISGIRRTGHLMFATGEVTTTGEAVAADEAVALNANGVNSFMTVVMPESTAVNPVVTVTMVSGATYTFQLAAPTALAAGKVYTANIAISGSHSTTESNRTVLGTFTVTDWQNVDAGNLTAGGSTAAAKWWYLEGNIDTVDGTTDGNWSKHIPFKCVGPVTWQVDFYYAGTNDYSTNGFKIRYAADAADWSESYGMSTGNIWVINVDDVKAEGAEGDPYLVHDLTSDNGTNIAMSAHGKFRIKFYTDTHNFHIYKLD